MSDKPKTFSSWLSRKLEIAPTKKDWENLNDMKDIIELGWNARDALAKEEIKATRQEMQEKNKELEDQYTRLTNDIAELRSKYLWDKYPEYQGALIGCPRECIGFTQQLVEEMQTDIDRVEKQRDNYKVKWNLCDALSTKYHSKNVKMQAELDKRDALVQECLNQQKQNYGMTEGDAIHFRMRKVFSILEYDYQELNQRGEDE